MTWQLKVGIAVALLASAFWAGWEWRDRSCDLAVAQADLATETARDAAEDALIDAALADQARLQAEAAAREAEGRVIVKRVIEYVQDPDAGKCDLPDDWVLLHDDAWRNAASAGGAEPAYGPDRNITDTEAIAVAAGNAEVCGRAIAQVKGWQEFWRNLKATQNE